MALEGTLQDMSMSDLFQIFRLGPKSGILLLDKANERGVIYVDRGKLIDAFVVQGTERTVVATADEAVLHTLTWDDAAFVFRHDLSVAGRAARIEHDGEWLILESMRRRSDPMQALPYHKITLDTQLQLSPLPSNAESSVSLDVDQWRILSHAANNQNLRTICEATGIEAERATRIVAELLSIGLVEIAPPKKVAPASSARPAVQSGQPAALNAGTPTDKAPVPVNAEGGQSTKVGRGLLNAIMRRINEL